MKTCPTAKQLANFEHDAITAVMSFAVSSGFGRFLGSEKLHTVFGDMKEESYDNSIIPEAFQPLVQEIAAELTDEIEERIVKDYLNHIDKSAKLVTCSSCGMKAFEMGGVKHCKMLLKDLQTLQCSKEQIVEIKAIPEEFRYIIYFPFFF